MAKSIYYVSQKTFRWAQTRWAKHDIRIDSYISDDKLIIFKPGRKDIVIRICPVIAKAESEKWYEEYRIGRALKKWMGK